MKTLWSKQGIGTDPGILDFTRGRDAALDRRLVPYDIVGSIAHARGLERIGVLDAGQADALCSALADLLGLWERGRFGVQPDDEDVHTALERALVERLGEVGRTIHAGRSRNDQVLTALRLYMKEALLGLMRQVASLALAACEAGQEHAHEIMPGTTHGRRAMPSSVGFWYASLAEGWADALEAGRALHARLDASPLGAAAGFGVPLPLDREHTALLMGFGRVHANAQAVQNSRGRLEASLLTWLVEAGRDVEKMATDLMLFSSAEAGFARLPPELCTGSSIMPQKRNPDVLELLRASCQVIRSCRDEVEAVIAKLPSGYQRDLQLTKEPLARGIDAAGAMVRVAGMVIGRIEWDAARLEKACTTEIFAAHRATALARGGVAFRDAYLMAAAELESGETDPWERDPASVLEALVHTGAPGNPGLREAGERVRAAGSWVDGVRSELESRWEALVGGPRAAGVMAHGTDGPTC